VNTVLARTFLEVVESGSFLAAAERLIVTQSTVSMRIKALEEEVGRQLFVRGKSGTEPTAAGHQLRPYVELLLNAWERARQEIALPTGIETVLAIGAEGHLWDSFLISWLSEFRSSHTQIAVRAETGEAAWLMRQLSESLLDIVVTYAPSARSGVVVEPLYDEKLVLVAHIPRGVERWRADYIYTDWGFDFREAHTRAYPGVNRPMLTGNLGALTVRLILDGGGSGYFPIGAVREHLARKALFLVSGAPVFERRVYCVFARQRKARRLVPEVIEHLRASGRRAADCEMPGPPSS